MIRMATICSGIGAPEVASVGLNFSHQFVAEIEPFPSAVLAHHWPHVPNLGDMTKINGEEWRGQVDVLVGGTPCQAFSVAGKRESLADERGNLTLKFVELCDAINPAYVVWENVPGVLSTVDNAFGCFLGALSGNDGELFPAGDGWSNSGCVIGPRRKLAWRILDAQYFGLAQRRRRVFVVACPRNGADPCEVLFEREGVQRHSAPSREKGEGASSDASASTGVGVDLQNIALTGAATGTLDAEGQKRGNRGQGVVACFGGSNTAGPIDVATARNASGTASGTASGRLDFESETFAVCITGPIAHALKAAGYAGSEYGTGRGQPIVFHPTQDPIHSEDGSCHALGCGSKGGTATHAVAFNVFGGNKRKDRPEGGFYVEENPDATKALDATGGLNPTCSQGGVCVAFAQNQLGEVRTGEVANTLNTNFNASGRNTPCVAFNGDQSAQTRSMGESVERSPTLRADVPVHAAHSVRLANTSSNGWGIQEDVTHTLDQTTGPAIHTNMQVRRLTARECERLQGFPDDYTRIPWRNKPAEECPDGPRYKALGNSMAVPSMRWILERLSA